MWQEMKEFRCRFCHKLLFKIIKNELGLKIEGLEDGNTITIFENTEAEIVCLKCKKKNSFVI